MEGEDEPENPTTTLRYLSFVTVRTYLNYKAYAKWLWVCQSAFKGFKMGLGVWVACQIEKGFSKGFAI